MILLGSCVTYKSMITSKYNAAIQAFIETPVFTAAEARAAGIPSRMLTHFCKKGVILFFVIPMFWNSLSLMTAILRRI